MNKIIIKREYFGIHYNNACPFCGLNTNLLGASEKVVVESRKYCKHCYQNGTNSKRVIPKDFYEIFHCNHNAQDPMENVCKESICNKLARLELAHLYGEPCKEDSMYLDLFYDANQTCIYFRLSICDDDDPWFGTETYNYLSPEQAVEILNKNGIHILDGITMENWMDYFSF